MRRRYLSALGRQPLVEPIGLPGPDARDTAFVAFAIERKGSMTRFYGVDDEDVRFADVAIRDAWTSSTEPYFWQRRAEPQAGSLVLNTEVLERLMGLEPQPQPVPGLSARMDPQPDYGEESYKGSGKLTGRAAIVTGGDSGIGRAVALAYAREGADVLIAFLPEEQEDADETKRLVETAGKRCVQASGDLQDQDYCRSLPGRAVDAFGRLDILVNNAAFQTTRDRIEDIGWDEWRKTWAINVDAMFLLLQAALPLMKAGASIINTTSVNSDNPPPVMSVYDATKAAIANFTASLGALVAERGIRVNSVAPGPIWTPLIVSTMLPEQMGSFGDKTPMKRPGQPSEVAPLYVWLASDEASYVTGARYAVTGGLPIL